MIKAISLITLMSFSVGAYAQSKISKVNIKTSIFCDHCSRCESCAPRLKDAVHGLKGIKRVDVDDKKQMVTVVYNSQKITLEMIKAKIAAAGFDADDVKAEAKGYSELDDCCKGK